MIHHLNGGTLRPRFPKLRGIVYCLLLESSEGLVLVDTGFGLADYQRPGRMMRGFLWLMGSPKDAAETMARQVARLGYQPGDVAHIVMTHLHLDHAGGLASFPQAVVHVSRREYEVARRPRGLVERGYVQQHWAHGPNWRLYDQVDGEWFGFESMALLPGIEPEIRLLPLPGHTSGHCGVVIRQGDGWLFHCGDAASPFHQAVDVHEGPAGPYALRFVPAWVTRHLIGPHVGRIRALLAAHGDEIEVISSHDTFSFERHQGQGGGQSYEKR